MHVVTVKPQRAQPLFARHPWVYAGSVETVAGSPADGDAVEVRASGGKFIAHGLYNSNSKIRVRLYSWDADKPIDDALFADKIRHAVALRHDVLHLAHGPRPAYRAVFSEADGLSGLTADRYGDFLSVQFTGLGLANRRASIGPLLMAATGTRGVYLRTEKGIGALEGLELRDGVLCGDAPPSDLVIDENGLQFAVNLTEGQKTGHYLDQRENRAVVAGFAPGRRVLDSFSYSGGFGVTAAKAGAAEVECVDASESALQLAYRNAQLNGLSQLTVTQADVFAYHDKLIAADTKFDLLILDPPKFARNRAAVPKALQGYKKLHQQAMKLLAPDGIMVSCCCTGLISQTDFEDVIVQVAGTSGRDVQILQRRGPSADHPTAVACRETGYLKCVISRVG